jgi:gliding motility-associated-like protein
VFVPNSFTPDDDGINDVFIPSVDNPGRLDVYHLMIFDRWGTLIFETHDPLEPWIGNVNRGYHLAQSDSYNWKLIFRARSEEIQELSGWVTMVR